MVVQDGNEVVVQDGNEVVVQTDTNETSKKTSKRTKTDISLKGSFGYMSPELRSGDLEWGNAAALQDCDVWAMGIIILEMLTGESPYECRHKYRLEDKYQELQQVTPAPAQAWTAKAAQPTFHIARAALTDVAKRPSVDALMASQDFSRLVKASEKALGEQVLEI